MKKSVYITKNFEKAFPKSQFLGQNKIATSAVLEGCQIENCMIGSNVELSNLKIQNAKILLQKNKKQLKKNIFCEKYFNFLINYDKNLFDGIKILIVAPCQSVCDFVKKLFEKLHAEVCVEVFDCGEDFAPKINFLQKLFQKSVADLGFVFDESCTKIFAINHNAQVLDGDCILFLMAWWFGQKNTFKHKIVVGTQTTNLGIENKLRAQGFGLVRALATQKSFKKYCKKLDVALGAMQDGFVYIKCEKEAVNTVLVARILCSIFLQNKRIWERVKENKYVQSAKSLDFEKLGITKNITKQEIKTFENYYSLKLKTLGRVMIWKKPHGLGLLVEGTEKITTAILAIDLKRKILKHLKNKKNN